MTLILCRTFVGLSLTLLSIASHAQSCRKVDLRKELGPPRHQNDTNLCFAEAAADLVSQKIKRRVSGFDLGVQFYLGDEKALRRRRDESVQTYLTRHPDIFDRLRESRNWQREAYSPSRILTSIGIFSLGGWEDGAILLGGLKGYCPGERLEDDAHSYPEYFLSFTQFTNQQCKVGLTCDHKKNLGSIRDAAANFSAHAMMSWIDDRCRPRVRPNSPLVPKILYYARHISEFNDAVKSGAINKARARKRIFAEINRALDHGRPSSISFDGNEIMNSDSVSGDHSDHSALIAARRKINGKCHYFIRNSFGKYCSYKPNLKCEEQAGGVWVRPEDLTTVYGLITIP